MVILSSFPLSVGPIIIAFEVDREEELTRLNRSLHLTEDEADGAEFPSDVWSENIEDEGYYLVGHLLSTKPTHFEFLKEMLWTIMNLIKGMDFRAIEDGIYLFRFNHIIDNALWIVAHGTLKV
ncbi:hypothetical protein Salat_1875300 [Sesamum alatum]|uniref:Uncharacterized protein n=1 Tax=Sesamum alatum TaxID=300844 RepID=A0AAE2CI24_9LAMI|nr:hypothetical protein Salat_1875300 [Sesamum alatum]